MRRAPGEDDQQRAAGQPPQPVRQQAERRVVGPLRVVDQQHSRNTARRRPRRRCPTRRPGSASPHPARRTARDLVGRPVPDERRGPAAPPRDSAPAVGRRRASRRRRAAGRAGRRRAASRRARPRPRRRVPDQHLRARAPQPGRAAPRRAGSCRSPPRPRAGRPGRRRSMASYSARSAVRSSSRPTNGAGTAGALRCGGPARARRHVGPPVDRLVELGGLGQRRHAELAGQGADTLAVLRERRRPVSRSRRTAG